MTTTESDFDNQPLPDFFERGGGGGGEHDRPERTEDRVPRTDDGKKRPLILKPGETMPADPYVNPGRRKMLVYYRPSDYGKVLEDTYLLDRWGERKIVAGMLSSRALRLRWANIGDPEESRETKEQANLILKEAKQEARADEKALVGTELHTLTERRDRGMTIGAIPEEFEGNFADWNRLTANLEILDIECFVVEDGYRLAGTFDRLVRYHRPCANCGRYVRVLDLKSSGSTDFGAPTMAAQLGIYANSRYYDPVTGERKDLPEVCTCRGIIAHIPSGEPEGSGRLRWLNIAKGWNDVVRVATEIREIRRADNWWLEFEPQPDIMPLIAGATTRAELNGLHAMYRSVWLPEHTDAGNRRIEELNL